MTSFSRIGEGNGNPLQCSCLENPRDRGAWWAAISGVAQSQTRLKGLSSSSSSHVPSLLFDLRPNYGGGNEDNGNLLQKVPCRHCYTQCPQVCSRPLLTHASERGSWTLTGNSQSVSCGVTAPFFCVLVCIRFCLCHPRVCFPSPV